MQKKQIDSNIQNYLNNYSKQIVHFIDCNIQNLRQKLSKQILSKQMF